MKNKFLFAVLFLFVLGCANNGDSPFGGDVCEDVLGGSWAGDTFCPPEVTTEDIEVPVVVETEDTEV